MIDIWRFFSGHTVHVTFFASLSFSLSFTHTHTFSSVSSTREGERERGNERECECVCLFYGNYFLLSPACCLSVILRIGDVTNILHSYITCNNETNFTFLCFHQKENFKRIHVFKRTKYGLFFVYFCLFIDTMTNIAQNLTINGRSIDGVHGIQTRDHIFVRTY